MADNTTNAIYKALADFSALKREARQARRELGQLKAAEDAYNAASLNNRRAATTASQNRQKAVTGEVAAMRVLTGLLGRYTAGQTKMTSVVRLANGAIDAQNRSLATNTTRLLAAASAARAYALAQQSISRDTPTATTNIRRASTNNRNSSTRPVRFTPELPSMSAAEAAGVYAQRARDAEQATNRWSTAVGWLRRQFTELSPAMARANNGAAILQRNFQRFSNWRPRLTPPFVALVPIIAAVVAALNPLVALLGAVGMAAFGLASNIASLSGAFLALPGILSAVVAGIGSVVAAMGGVGNVFKTFNAMKKATGGSTGGAVGESAAERADRLARAELNLARAQRNVQKAQQSLNKAREQALKDLIDLRLEVSRASLNEERALVSLQEARDNYNNVMADPGSQLGDKMDAALRIKEAEAELEDVRRRNAEAQKELNEAERKGIENSDQVLDAKENLQDAILDEREAQRNLQKEYAGTSAGASALATATNEYQEALAKLSPSARTFVLALIALQGQWEEMRRSLQEAFFSEFVDQIDKLPQIIQNIGNFLRPAASSMGRFVDSFLQLLASPEWSSDIILIGESNGRILDSMGDGAISLMNALKDLMIAAAPFTEWLVSSLAIGAENFAELVKNGRESGDLARWLETVAGRLERWWNIIKNIGETLFNYGAASSEFGDWLSEGFLEKTEGWKENSKEAREEGSEFQKFLENIKPLLSAVNDLFASFFGWLGEEIMDPANIQDATDLVTLIDEELGPALSGFFDALAETDIDESFVKALASIVESLTALIEAGGGAGFEAFFDTLVWFFGELANFAKSLPEGAFAGALSFLGVMAGLSFIGKFTGLTSAIGWLLKLDKAKFLGALGLLGKLGVVGAVAGAVVGGAVSTANNLGNIGSDLNRANEAAAQGDGAGVRTALTENGAIAKSFFGLGQTRELLGFAAEMGIVPPEWQEEFDNWLRDMSEGMFDWLANDFSSFLSTAHSNLLTWGSDIQTSWNNTWTWIGFMWDTFSANLKFAWDNFWGQIKLGWDTFWANISAGWRLLWGTTIPTAWNNFTSWLGAGWNGFWGGLGNGLQSMVNWFGQIWNTLQNKFRDPINWVIQSVYNDGIRRLWNDYVAKPFGWTQLGSAPLIGSAPSQQSASGGGRGALKYARGGTLPGFSPGVDNHHFVDQNGIQLDLGGGEGILVPEAVREIGGPAQIDKINRSARYGFADGGVFANAPKSTFGQRAGRGGVWEVAGDLWDKFQSFFKNPIGWITNTLMGGGVRSIIEQLRGQSLYGGLISRIPGKAIENLANLGATRAKEAKRKADDGGATGAMGAGSAMGWQNQWNAVKKAFPNARLNSAYRPGAITSTGSKSYHGQGRAIDINPSMEIFNWIKANYGANSRELIYSPANRRQIQNGREYMWPEPIRSQHQNHVHWAMRQGGVVPKLYDQGGWLPHNGAAINRSGKPEAVLTAAESQALKGLLAGSGLNGGAPAFGGPGAVSSLRGTAQQVNDYSVNVGTVTINNPVPEAPSVSLPKAIRQIGYMQNARANS